MTRTNVPASELMTPDEAAKWFRRSASWLRQQRELLRFGDRKAQPLFHVNVCRAYVLGKLAGLPAPRLKQVQVQALAADCRLAGATPFDPSIDVPKLLTLDVTQEEIDQPPPREHAEA